MKLYCKSLSVLSQDRLLDTDVVKFYLVLFSSLISKPDLSSSHRDPIFIVSTRRVGRAWRNGADSCRNPGQVFPLWWKWFRNPPQAGVGVVKQTISLKNGSSFLSSWVCSPGLLLLLTLPLVLSRRERIALCSFFALPWLPRLSFGNLTATSLCRALDNIEPGLTQTHEFPSLKP